LVPRPALKLIKIGAKVVRHGCYVALPMTEGNVG
jgi:hypothetical protein